MEIRKRHISEVHEEKTFSGLLCEKCKLCHYSIKGENPSQSLGINDIDSETVLSSLSVQAETF